MSICNSNNDFGRICDDCQRLGSLEVREIRVELGLGLKLIEPPWLEELVYKEGRIGWD